MISVKGKWYDGTTSLQTSAVLKVFDNGAVQIEQTENGHLLFRQSQWTAKVSDRLADTPRFLTFPDGVAFETKDNVAIDIIFKKFHHSSWSRWVYLLESQKRYLLIGVIGVVLIMAAMVKYGIPMAADIIASFLPQSYYELADRQTLKALDRMFLKPSQLPPQTKRRVQKNLQECIDAHKSLDITLVFKKGGKLGPNAFALPGGTVVFTDEMVEIAENDQELTAVLAHEIGHVVYRHGMRRMIQDSLLSFTVMALTGDTSGVSEIFLGLPVILTELAYSREFERMADQYALDYLRSYEIPPSRFADILVRIEKSGQHQQKGNQKKLSDYLSTHPLTKDRIKKFVTSQ